MSNLPVRAAGRTLCAGELREALAGVPDGEPIWVAGAPIFAAEPRALGLELLLGSGDRVTDEEEGGLEDAHDEIAELEDEVDDLRQRHKKAIEILNGDAA